MNGVGNEWMLSSTIARVLELEEREKTKEAE